jgi:hypothetical protein
LNCSVTADYGHNEIEFTFLSSSIARFSSRTTTPSELVDVVLANVHTILLGPIVFAVQSNRCLSISASFRM